MENEYEVEGQMIQNTMGGVVALIASIAVAVLLLIFTGVLSGQAYQQSEADLDAITNTTIKTSVKNAIISGFEAQEKTGDYLPLIVLAMVIGLVLTVVLSLVFIPNMTGGRGGGAL